MMQNDDVSKQIFYTIPKSLYALSGLNLIPPVSTFAAVWILPKNEWSTVIIVVLCGCFLFATFLQVFMFWITFRRDNTRDLLDRLERLRDKCESQKEVLVSEKHEEGKLKHKWINRTHAAENNLWFDNELFGEIKKVLPETEFRLIAKIDERTKQNQIAINEIAKTETTIIDTKDA